MMRFLFIILTLISLQAFSQQLELRETFADTLTNADGSGKYTSGASASTGSIYWSFAYGAGGTTPASSGVSTAIVAPYTGAGDIGAMDSTPVNVTYTTVTQKGFAQQATSSDRKFFFTTSNSNKYINQQPISRIGKELSRVRYATASNSNIWVSRFCVKVGSNWYAYGATGQQQAVVSGSSDGSAFSTHSDVWDITLNMSTPNWALINFQSDVALSVDTTSLQLLPAGDIVGYGIYFSRTTASSAAVRFDNIEIYSSPAAAPVGTTTTLVVRETFPDTTGYQSSGSSNTKFGWTMRMGTTDTLPNSTAINAPLVGSTLTDNTPIGVNYSMVSDTGYLQNGESNNIKLFYTTKLVSIQRSTQDLYAFRWVSANGSNVWGMRPVVQVSGQWFAYGNPTTQDSVNTGSDASAFAPSHATQTKYWIVTLNMSNGQWYPLTHNAGVELSLSTVGQNLPLGDITGYGMLYTRAAKSQTSTRFDTYEIYTSSGAPTSVTHKVQTIQN